MSHRQRVSITVCAKCRKTFAPGDRVSPAYIVQGIGRNPDTKSIETMMNGEFELVHVSCIDTQLEGKILTLS